MHSQRAKFVFLSQKHLELNLFFLSQKHFQLTLLGSFLNILGQKIIKRLRERLFTSILKQETAFFDRTRTGELINRLSADTILVGKAVTDNVSDGLRAVAQSVAGVSMMVSSS